MLNKFQLIEQMGTHKLFLDSGPLSAILLTSYNLEKVYAFDVGGGKKLNHGEISLLFSFIQDMKLFVSPQVLAEANSLLAKFVEKKDIEQLWKMNTDFLINGTFEVLIKKEQIFGQSETLKFGITDSAIIVGCKDKIILTKDWALYNYAQNNQMHSVQLDAVISQIEFC